MSSLQIGILLAPPWLTCSETGRTSRAGAVSAELAAKLIAMVLIEN